jgi:hypothetical protein
VSAISARDLICVPPDQLDAAWKLAAPFIESGYEALDEFMPPNMLSWLKAENGLLWIGVKGGKVVAALTTSLERRPSGLCLRMIASGGDDLDHMKICEESLVKYARAEGCAKISAEGRNGWARALPGYKVTRAYFEKVL